MSEAVVAAAQQLLSARLGFALPCIRAEKLREVLSKLRSLGLSDAAALERLASGEPEVTHAFEDAVVVGETFLFREPQHFELVLSEVLPAFLASGRSTFRVWSAGCASGEEAWSLAGLLLPQLEARDRKLSVLGTDVSSRAIARAMEGRYGKWSERSSAPCPVRLFEPGPAELRSIRSELRQVTHFSVQNLLLGPPALPEFDAIFCRNVLVYFEPEVAQRVATELVSRLTPEGLVAFGPMDLRSPLSVGERVGPVELNAWRQPRASSAPRRATDRHALTPLTLAVAPPSLDGSVVPLHLRALALLENGHWSDALRLLERANELSPDYLPALLERALIHERRGDRRAASTLMSSMLALAQHVEGPVPGPDELPAEYYRSTAEIFLARVKGVP